MRHKFKYQNHLRLCVGFGVRNGCFWYGIEKVTRIGTKVLLKSSIDMKDERIRCMPTRPELRLDYLYFEEKRNVNRDEDWNQMRTQNLNRKQSAARGRPIIVEWRDARHSAGLSRSVTHRYVTERYTFISDSQPQPNLRRCHVNK
ncbi:hypothetical protein EVAR_12334_1 [Eumeta japonica]|uniref:Uncharacterized protein n=1 Tax=Eumeta variegata TaxID=151549 RepID=A0A4C1WYM8_EUMVA|nr:hypothetical protein EVAR_12334_1 [Eumeta japonica]